MKKTQIMYSSWLYKLCLSLVITLITSWSYAQVTIKGTVTAKDGSGKPSITVVVLNTNFGANTDASGNYTLTAPLKLGKYTIQFSGMGFKTNKQTLTITEETSYTVNTVLAEDPLGLDEVVVTGTSAGTTKKQLGSYVSSINANQLNKGVAGNALQALQGKTPGAQITQNSGDPAGGLSVRLRGISSISSSSEPLYIVDGVIVNNGTNRVTNTASNYDGGSFVGSVGQSRLVDINPSDIEKIEVLNGAAAAAIYGSRANAGVVQIFTKRGKSGKPVISFSTSVIVSSLRKSVEVNQSPTKFGPGVDVFTQDVIQRNPKTGFPDTLSTIRTPVNRYNYNDYIFRNAIGTENNISISGGNEKTKYYASGSYYKNEGIIKNTDFSRYSFRINIDQNISSNLSFNMGLNFVNSVTNEKPDGNSFFSPMNSINIIGNFHDIQTKDAFGNIKAIGERGRVNPVSVIEDIKQRQETNRILTNIGLKFKPIKGLSIDYSTGIDQYTQRGQTFIPPFSYNVSTGFFGGGPILDATLNGYASTATNNFFQINNEISATYQFNITQNIGSTTQIGYNVQYEKNGYSLLQGRGLAPFVQTVNATSTPLPNTDDRSEISVSGAFIQQNLKFKNQFFLTGALRMDGSSVFAKNNRNQLYSKASASYVISEGDWWKNASISKWFNFAKIRIAYGESGNLTGIGAYSRFNSYATTAFLGRSAFTSSTTLANTNVKPERQREIEFGADLSFLENRLGLTVNIYNKKVKDLITNKNIAPTTGFSGLLNNIGNLENQGFELVLTGTPLKGDNFSWNTTFIYNRNRNKATNIGQALTLLATNAGAPVAIIEGQPIGVFYGTFFARDNAGNLLKDSKGLLLTEKGAQTSNKPLEYTTARNIGTGLPDGSVLRKVIGDPNPDYTATLTNEFTYKKLSFRMQIDVVQGVDIFNADWRTRQGVGNGKEAEKEQTGIYPRGYVNSAYNIEEWRSDDGSFVKLRELSLSYNLGTFKALQDLTVSFAGRNLISWDNYKGYDPEVNAGGQSTILRGIDFGAVPIPKTFSLTVNAKF